MRGDGKGHIACRRCKTQQDAGPDTSKKAAGCKNCRTDDACCPRMAARQGKADWLNEAEQNDPQSFAPFLTTYSI